MSEQRHHEPLLDDPHFRRLAGEGWHPDGLNTTLLGALAFEELLYEDVNEEAKRPQGTSLHTLNQYASQKRHVEQLKEELGIGDPPPLSPEE